MSDSVPPHSAPPPPHNVFYGCFPAPAKYGVRSSVIGKFTSHIQIMDDIPRRFLSGRRLCHVPEWKGWSGQSVYTRKVLMKLL
jgi:hypothetical protein